MEKRSSKRPAKTLLSLLFSFVLLFGGMPTEALAEVSGSAASSSEDVSGTEEASPGAGVSADEDGSDEASGSDAASADDAGDSEEGSGDGSDTVLEDPAGSDSSDPELDAASDGSGDAGEQDAILSTEAASELDELAAQHVDAIEDGTYAILNNKSGRGVLDVANGSTSAGANVQLYESNGSDAQLWEVSHDEDGYVTFTNVGSGMALHVAWSTAESGTNVQQYTSSGTTAQKWVVVPDDLGGFTIISALSSDLALDIEGGSTSNGTNIQIYTVNGSAAQSFEFVSTDVDVDACEDVLGDGWYTMTPGCASGKVVGVDGASCSSGAGFDLYTGGTGVARLFSFEFVDDDGDGSGYYMICNACSGKYVAVPGGDVVPGAAIEQESADEDDGSQLWSAVDNGNGTCTFVNKATGLVLEIEGSSSSVGAAVVSGESDGSSAQRFTLTKKTDLLRDGIYTIKAASGTSYVLDVPSASVSAGASIQLYSSNSTLAQKWCISKVDGYDNTYTIESVVSGKCLTAENGDLVQRVGDGGKDQMWIPTITSSGITFKNKSSGKVIDIASGKIASGTNVRMYKSNGTKAQNFRISSASASLPTGTYYVCMASSSGKVLEVKNGSSSNGANVQLHSKNSNAGYQKWKITKNGDGTYSIKNCETGKMLVVKNGKASNGTNVQQYRSNGVKGQKWYIAYSEGGWKIASAVDSSYVIDLKGGKTSNGTNVQVYKSNDTKAQRFVFSKTTYTASARTKMASKAQSYSSSTKYLILVNCSTNRVGIYKGSKGNWSEVKYWKCTTGASSTPTVKGTFTVKSKGYSFGSSSYTCYYYTQFYGNYLFHSVLYYPNTFTVKDGTLGANKSHGCVRLSLDNAKWIYNNIPIGTKVVIY